MSPPAPPRTEGALPEKGREEERRRLPRTAPSVQLRATIIDVAGQHRSAVVQDVSGSGTRLKLVDADAGCALLPGQEIEIHLSSSGALIKHKARVAWAKRGSDGRWEMALDYREQALPEQPQPQALDLALVKIDPAWALRIPAGLALRRQVLPLCEVDGEVHVACADPQDEPALRAVARHIDRPLRPLAAEPDSLRRVLKRLFGEAPAAAEADDPVAICDELLYAAWLRQASDIHLDPDRDGVRVRLRVDGQLEDYKRLPTSIHTELISRIKILGGMDIAEKRAPQDGRFTQPFGSELPVDIRVATLPTKHGERATLRLLGMQVESLVLDRIGLSERDHAICEATIRRPQGMILATGPTGCGKTTTLYAALRRVIAHRPVNAITVQDPVEYDIPGAAQVEVDSAQKVTFASALRSILRHDPDVLMIGEIRDHETADIAIKSALTGHLVLATLHTNSASSAITRLTDIGVDRYLTSATLRLVLSQRLVRKLCSKCRAESALTAAQARALGRPQAEGMTVFESRGCVYCAGRGYTGRLGVFELLSLDDDEWTRAVARGVDEPGLNEMMRSRNIPTMVDDAISKLAAGTTSLHDVLAAVAV
ncbi:MAG TPA: GspE/PulE family protein [Planctomycetota bacterium]|nr:GspE/PulE family protein [Planctomycetota bacterium]